MIEPRTDTLTLVFAVLVLVVPWVTWSLAKKWEARHE